MKAVILAGGEGSRLRPLTSSLPKPMVPVMNKPLLEHTILLLKHYGITEVGITLMYHPQLIKDYFGDGQSLGVNITYFLEETPLGTAGGLKQAKDFLDQTFIIISGDALTNLDISKALEFHSQKSPIATLILTREEIPLNYGVVLTDENGAVKGFVEKPSWGELYSDTINTGTYILEPEILDYIDNNKNTDFSRDVFPALLKTGESIYGYVMKEYWCDIGDIRSYIKAHCDILDKKMSFEVNADQIKDNVWVGPGTIIDKNAEINGPCFIGSNCKIGSGTIINNYSVIGNNTIIEDDVSVARSIIWENGYIAYGSELRGAVLCNRVNLKHYVSIFENAVIGEGCRINERAIVKSNIKIWPEKVIEALAIVDRNMIWGSRHTKRIFGEIGISGIINVDISPEFATRLGAAFGSQFKMGTRVVVSSTNSNSARMFKHAFISGILSVGVEVYNMSSLLTPISRCAIKLLGVEGGIHIKSDIENPNMVRVDFMDRRGAYINRLTEQKIENSLFKEDFKRCSSQQISRLDNITDFYKYYMRCVFQDIDSSIIVRRKPVICLFSRSDFVLSLTVPLLTKLGCKVKYCSTPNINDVVFLLKKTSDAGADFGAVIDDYAENLMLIDKNGKVIKEDLFQALIALIIFKTNKKSTFYKSISYTDVIDKMAYNYNCSVKKTKVSPHSVMDEILNSNNINVNPIQLILGFDAIAGLAKIIEYIYKSNTTLNNLVSEIPEFFMVKKAICCPWDLKGTVMRTIISENKDKNTELFDGIKIYHDEGWTLIISDADSAVFKVISEGNSPKAAQLLNNIYCSTIERIVKNISYESNFRRRKA